MRHRRSLPAAAGTAGSIYAPETGVALALDYRRNRREEPPPAAAEAAPRAQGRGTNPGRCFGAAGLCSAARRGHGWHPLKTRLVARRAWRVVSWKAARRLPEAPSSLTEIPDAKPPRHASQPAGRRK